MSNFKALKSGQLWRIVLETKGPRSFTEQEAFRVALLELIGRNRTTVLGYQRGQRKKQRSPRGRRRRR